MTDELWRKRNRNRGVSQMASLSSAITGCSRCKNKHSHTHTGGWGFTFSQSLRLIRQHLVIEALPKDEGWRRTFYEAINQQSKHPQKYSVSVMQTKFHPSLMEHRVVMYGEAEKWGGGYLCTFCTVGRSMALKGCLQVFCLIDRRCQS